MPITGPVKSIYPGTRALLMGIDTIYGVPTPAGASPVVTKLGGAGAYALLGASGVTSSVSTFIAGGNVGSFPTNTITGSFTYTAPAAQVTATAQDQVDLAAAIVFFQGLTATAIGASFATHTFTATATGYNGGPGFVGFASSTLLFTGGTITLDGAGLSNPIFVFQVGSALNVTTAATTIVLINNATAANVVWVVGSSATFDAHDHVWSGQILAHTSITLNSAANMTLAGRALANTGAVVVTNTSHITASGTSSAVGPKAEVFPGNAASVPMVIAPRTPTQNSSRTVIWRVFPAGAAVDLKFQVSIDANPLNFVTVDEYNGTGNSGSREIQADNVTGVQSTAMSSARFVRVLNNSGTPVSSLIVDWTAQ